MENPDFEQFPGFEGVQCYDIVVGPGDVVYIPKGWWHYISSLSASISVSFWF